MSDSNFQCVPSLNPISPPTLLMETHISHTHDQDPHQSSPPWTPQHLQQCTLLTPFLPQDPLPAPVPQRTPQPTYKLTHDIAPFPFDGLTTTHEPPCHNLTFPMPYPTTTQYNPLPYTLNWPLRSHHKPACPTQWQVSDTTSALH